MLKAVHLLLKTISMHGYPVNTPLRILVEISQRRIKIIRHRDDEAFHAAKLPF